MSLSQRFAAINAKQVNTTKVIKRNVIVAGQKDKRNNQILAKRGLTVEKSSSIKMNNKTMKTNGKPAITRGGKKVIGITICFIFVVYEFIIFPSTVAKKGGKNVKGGKRLNKKPVKAEDLDRELGLCKIFNKFSIFCDCGVIYCRSS